MSSLHLQVVNDLKLATLMKAFWIKGQMPSGNQERNSFLTNKLWKATLTSEEAKLYLYVARTTSSPTQFLRHLFCSGCDSFRFFSSLVTFLCHFPKYSVYLLKWKPGSQHTACGQPGGSLFSGKPMKPNQWVSNKLTYLWLEGSAMTALFPAVGVSRV